MPRKSAAALAVMPGEAPREPPPRHLPARRAGRMEARGRRFAAAVDSGRRLCAVGNLLRLDRRHARHRALMLAEPEGSAIHAEASKLYRREADMVVKLGKTLRLGPRHDRTKLRAVSTLLKPWDLGRGTGEPAEPAAKGFEGFDWTPPKDDGAALKKAGARRLINPVAASWLIARLYTIGVEAKANGTNISFRMRPSSARSSPMPPLSFKRRRA